MTRSTAFAMPAGQVEPGIQAIYAVLAADSVRNELIIVADVLAAVAAGRSCSACRPGAWRRLV